MKIIVIGGGVGGLAAAHRLVEAGHDVRVLEPGPPGGVVRTRTEGGFALELAASSFLGAPDGAGALCRELGVDVVPAAPAARRRWIYIDGKLRALPGGPLGLARTDLFTWRGKLDLLREPLRPARDVASEGDESIHDFAARRFGPEAARAVIAPFVTGIFAADSHEVSLAAGFPKLAEMDRQGGVLRSMLRGLRGRKGRPPSVPGRGLWAPRDGMAALPTALRRTLGARFSAEAARAVAPVDRGVTVETAAGAERYDAAVLAAPARDAAGLVERAIPELASRLVALRRSPAAIVFLGYDAAAVGDADLAGFGFLVAQGEELRLLGAVYESTVWPVRAPAGKVLLRCIFGGGRDPGAMALSDAELAARARADVERALGTALGEPILAHVARWDAGIAQYPVGHRDRMATLDSIAGRHRIVLAGADYHGIGLNDVIADARRVVTEVAAWA